MTQNQNSVIGIVLIIIAVVIVYVIYRKNFKLLKVPSVCLITGGVKTGKSLLSVKLSILDYKKRHRKWWFVTHILRRKMEEPLYYTNVSISFGNLDRRFKKNRPHRLDKNIVRLNTDLLLRSKRFNYKSVIYIQECSLLADNMDYNNKVRNVDLSLFNKLIAHETRGGAVYYDTQSPLDSHYSIKRVSSIYFFIEKNFNFGLFQILYVREMINTENGVNNFVDDVETSTRKVLVPFWWYYKYDRYEFSYLTDDLETCNVQTNDKRELVSFNPLYIERGDKRIATNETEVL